MRKQYLTNVLLLLLAMFVFACSSSDDDDVPPSEVKMELESTITEINQVLDAIHETRGYEIISVVAPQQPPISQMLKSAIAQSNPMPPDISVGLSDVQGVYDYMPSNPVLSDGQMFYQTVFVRSGDSDNFVIRAPLEKVLDPQSLHIQEAGDENLVNNIEVSASEYQLTDNATSFDYTLRMALSVDNNPAGSMFVRNQENTDVDVQFQFTNDINAAVRFIVQGTNISQELVVSENDVMLYRERASGVLTADNQLESFQIRIGVDNIEFVKSSTSDDYQVFRGGNLEENVVVVPQATCDSPEQGFCADNLNLDITFEDGTTLNLANSLGDDGIQKMTELFRAMYQVYAVQYLVDGVAVNFVNANP